MKWSDIVAAALNNLMRRKLRSALTMLGVVIGTAAIVVTISLGYGAEQTQMRELETYTNLRQIVVYPYYGGRSTSTTSGNKITKITDSVAERMRRIDGVEALTPMQYVSFGSAEPVLKSGKLETEYTMMIAVYPRDFMKFANLKEGRYFTGNTSRMEFIMSEMAMMEFMTEDVRESDDRTDAYELLMSGKALDAYLPKIDWLRDKFTFSLRWEEYDEDSANVDDEAKQYSEDFSAKMVGYIEGNIDGDWTLMSGAIVDINWVKRVMREKKALIKELSGTAITSYDSIYVLVESVNDVERVFNALAEMGLQPSSAMQHLNQMKKQIQTMQAFLGFIGMISMLVAALSIANTMMMSIYERTREIGVMKVLGCKLGNIRMMFLSEAAYIGIFGGALGLLLSYALSYALNNVPALQQMVASVMSTTGNYGSAGGGTTSIIPWQLGTLTWLGVSLVSVLSGIQPAQRAMRLSSLAAIRSSD